MNFLEIFNNSNNNNNNNNGCFPMNFLEIFRAVNNYFRTLRILPNFQNANFGFTNYVVGSYYLRDSKILDLVITCELSARSIRYVL